MFGGGSFRVWRRNLQSLIAFQYNPAGVCALSRAERPVFHLVAAQPQGVNVDFDARQTRRFVLAGTVAFPKPYPSIGTISFEKGSFRFSPDHDPKHEDLIVVQERSRGGRLLIRIFLRCHVAAIFVPGGRSCEGRFRISCKKWASDPRKGEWFLESDVNLDAVRKRLDLGDADIETRESVLRGIAYAAEHRPVLTVLEESTLAVGSRDLAMIVAGGTSAQCTCDKYHSK